MERRKVWLTADQAQAMLDLAKTRSKRDYLLLSLMRWGLRCGEIVGWRGLPGIHPEDVRVYTIWVKGKGYAGGIVQDIEVAMPADLLQILRDFIIEAKIGEGSRVFPITEPWAERITKWYARQVGIADWKYVSPHRLRAFFATDAKDKGKDHFMIRDLMRHKNVTTTNLYVGPSSTGKMVKVVKELAES